MKEVFSIRLKQLRVMQGLSMDLLCKRVNNALSKQSISKYESGKMMPDSKSLIVLANALNVSIDYFFRPIGLTIDRIEFKRVSKLKAKQLDSIKEIIKDKLERYFEVESILDVQSEYMPEYQNIIVQSEKDVYNIVNLIKSDWRLGEDGINNLIEILEENKIKVIEIDAPNVLEGLCGFADKTEPFIVLNKNFSSERKRFTALHELAHLVVNFDTSLSENEVENLCNLFASEMLISKDVLIKKIGQNRGDISLLELKDIQIQFGISIEELMRKAQHLNIITENRYKTFCIKKKNADFRDFVEKSRTRDEDSNRFTRLVYRALASEIISISKASSLLNTPIEVVRGELNLA